MLQQTEFFDNLNEYAKKNLTPSQGGFPYACPFCESGNHPERKNSDSAFSITENGKGFSCLRCGENGDIKHFFEVLKDPNARPANLRKKHAPSKIDPVKLAKNRDHEREYISLAQKTIRDPKHNQGAFSYLKQRGYTLEQAQLLNIGFDYTNGHPRLKQPALIIPYQGAEYFHVDRDITGKASHKYDKPPGVGEEPIFNESALDTAECVVIVEGAFDALALLTLGITDIIPLIGAKNAHTAIPNAIKKRIDAGAYKDTRPPAFCLMLDDDSTGIDSQNELADSLAEMLIPHISVDTSYITDANGKHPKDADEMRLIDPEALEHAVKSARTYVLKHYNEMRDQLAKEKRERVCKKNGVEYSENTLNEIKEFKGIEPPIPTGIKAFDDYTHGGLHNELTVLCAGSSVGKTTLAVQIADNIAQSGTPVLFVTVEQSRRECIAKSLSRASFRLNPECALTSTEINYLDVESDINPETRRELVQQLAEQYQQSIAPNLYYMQPDKQPNVHDIIQVVQAMTETMTRPPVVFIDYLQLLAPANEYETDKRQTADNSVTKLRQFARDQHTPIFIISSINRESYWQGVALDSAKESGGIEYSADLLLGLQPYDLTNQVKATAKKKGISLDKATGYKEASRELFNDYKNQPEKHASLLILKNRNGRTTESNGIRLKNNSTFNSFVSDPIKENEA